MAIPTDDADIIDDDGRVLRKGWTTGACATAASKAAYIGIMTGEIPLQVQIQLPKGQTPIFDIINPVVGDGWAQASVIKDAGDDPDVTHRAEICARVERSGDEGIRFRAGQGVGTVTLPGLPLAVGEPAINPAPRAMITANLEYVASACNVPLSVNVEISVPNGAVLAQKTWNPRLGIIGGISILGTTGIVIPYSCSAWIHSIHRGIDVARAMHTPHIAAVVGSTSERMVQSLYALPETSIIDMGDFVGGMLKYLRRNPVPKLTIAGGFAKLSKLAGGAMDLHSGRSQLNRPFMEMALREAGASVEQAQIAHNANTALEILQTAQALNLPIGDICAQHAKQQVINMLSDTHMDIEILMCDRNAQCVGRA